MLPQDRIRLMRLRSDSSLAVQVLVVLAHGREVERREEMTPRSH